MSTNVRTGDGEAVSKLWRPATRRLVSFLLVAHLLSVFLPPFAFQASLARGFRSPLAESALKYVQPYIDFAYLHHGYAFFAPDPGPSHLLRATLEFADSRPPLVVTMPDRQRHWPRLLYHRYFMLSEHLHAAFAPGEPPPEIREDPQQLADWRLARTRYELRRQAIERQLMRRHDAVGVSLERIEHRLLDPFEKLSLRKRVDDADTFLQLSEGEAGGGRP